MVRAKDSIVGMELGRALADRLGLNPDTTDMEWSALSGDQETVHVRFVTLVQMPAEDFNELVQVATKRAAA